QDQSNSVAYMLWTSSHPAPTAQPSPAQPSPAVYYNQQYNNMYDISAILLPLPVPAWTK
ncbi:hypothetical protein RJZ90_006145, partial [Blastomyces dermatitidis]